MSDDHVDDDARGTQILKFDPGAHEVDFRVDHRGCEHRSVTVAAKTDDVKCSNCGAALNPFWALRELIGQWSKKMGRLQELRELEAKERARNRNRTISRQVQSANDMQIVARFPSCQNRGGCSKRSETTGLWYEANGDARREGRCGVHRLDFRHQIAHLEETK